MEQLRLIGSEWLWKNVSADVRRWCSEDRQRGNMGPRGKAGNERVRDSGTKSGLHASRNFTGRRVHGPRCSVLFWQGQRPGRQSYW